MKQTIEFTEDVEVLDDKEKITFEAKAGDVVELLSSSCTRWVRRKKAVLTDKKPGKAKADKPDGKKSGDKSDTKK